MVFWLYQSRERGEPVKNFNHFIDVFKERYANSDLKEVDWQAIHHEYIHQINASTKDAEIFAVFQEILDDLDDKHCRIYRFNQLYFSGFERDDMNYWDLLSFDYRVKTNDFSLEVVQENYLRQSYEKSLQIVQLTEPPFGIRHVFTTGWLPDSIAYIHISEMSREREGAHKAISAFYNKYNSANGFVIDVRDNFGGWAIIADELAGKFIKDERVYAVSRLRETNGTFAYKDPEYWTVKPSCKKPIVNKPIAVLVNKNTASSAELFVLRMKTVAQVKVMGNTTAGIFGDMYNGQLPNGWHFGLPVRVTNDRHDVPLETIGITPDLIILNNRSNLDSGQDKVMDYAIQYLTDAN